jgi:hypothetical protein
MKRIAGITLLAAILLTGGGWVLYGRAAGQSPESDILKATDEILTHVVKLRGLEPTGPISKGVRSREEISQFLNERVREEYTAADLEAEGKVLRILGLLPDSLQYKEFMLELLTEQVGGYYDPDKKTLFLARWLPLDQQKPVMAHELTHALQDQHFNVGRVMTADRRSQNDDKALAHQAIFEGDGMAVMLDYLLEPTGRNFSQLPDLVFVMRAQFALMDSQFKVFAQAPGFIKETLLFPYGYGAAFLQKVRAKQPWSAVDAIYHDLPSSTEQILHPERYFGTRDEPRTVQIEDPSSRLGEGWHTTYRNVLGEFQLSVVLGAGSGNTEEQARRAAAGWGGDQLILVESGTRSFVVLSTVWDSQEDAGEFFDAVGAWLSKRFPKASRTDGTPAAYALTDAGASHEVKRDGDRVRIILGLPQTEAAKLKGY